MNMIPADLRNLADQYAAIDEFGYAKAFVQAMRQAADEIERLHKELEATQESLNEACIDGNHNADLGVEWKRQAQRAKEHCTVLREALVDIGIYHAGEHTCRILYSGLDQGPCDCHVGIAKQALEVSGGDGDAD